MKPVQFVERVSRLNLDFILVPYTSVTDLQLYFLPSFRCCFTLPFGPILGFTSLAFRVPPYSSFLLAFDTLEFFFSIGLGAFPTKANNQLRLVYAVVILYF